LNENNNLQVPIGAILAMAKSIAGVPLLTINNQFVECNGQVLSDAASPLNGQTMPDLNGATTKRFLRGGTASGATGGTETHTHSIPAEPQWPGGDINVLYDGTTYSTSTLPSYYEVVWVIRVK
jgi:hypothetical protein